MAQGAWPCASTAFRETPEVNAPKGAYSGVSSIIVGGVIRRDIISIITRSRMDPMRRGTVVMSDVV